MRTCELHPYIDRFWNPRYADLPTDLQAKVPEEDIAAIERTGGPRTFWFHVFVVGCREPLVWPDKMSPEAKALLRTLLRHPELL